MMATIEWFRHSEQDAAVRALYADCHAGWPPRLPDWYRAYPTLVVLETDTVVGFTSFSLSPGATGTLTLFGNDVCVAPTARGRGLGWALADARHAVGRRMGATAFVGFTAVDNVAMQHIFLRQGLHACQHVPGFFGPGGDAMAWVGAL